MAWVLALLLAAGAGVAASPVTEAIPPPIVAAPQLDPDGGSFFVDIVHVTVTCVTPGVTIRYLIVQHPYPADVDETCPIVANGGTVAMSIPSSLLSRPRLLVKAYLDGWPPSETHEAVFLRATISERVAAPTITPPGGARDGEFVDVTVHCATPGATMRYVLSSGMMPDNGPTLASPIIEEGGVIRVPMPTQPAPSGFSNIGVKAWKQNMFDSETCWASFTIARPVPPAFDPGGGEFFGPGLDVVLNCYTSNVAIHYTTDGSEPTTISQSVQRGASVRLALPGTLKAMAKHWGQETPSAVTTAHFGRVGGALRVGIEPAGAVQAGAKWRRADTSDWLAGGATESWLPAGDQMVEFKTIPGWRTPAPQAATIADQGICQLQGAYPLLIHVTAPQGPRAIRPGNPILVGWTSDIDIAGAAFFVALRRADSASSYSRLTTDLWQPAHIVDRQATIIIPGEIPSGSYRLMVISCWLLDQPALRPNGVYYGQSPLLTFDNSVPAQAWMLYR